MPSPSPCVCVPRKEWYVNRYIWYAFGLVITNTLQHQHTSHSVRRTMYDWRRCTTNRLLALTLHYPYIGLAPPRAVPTLSPLFKAF